MLKWISVALICFCSIVSVSAPSEIETLKKEIAASPADTNKVLAIQRLAKNFLLSKPDTALILSRQGLQLSQQIGFVRGEARAYTALGNAFLIMGNHPKALEYYLASLKMYEAMHNNDGIGVVLANIAMIHMEQGDYRNALSYNFQTARIFEDRPSEPKLLLTLLNIGDAYDKLNIQDSALHYTQKGYDLALRIKDKEYIGMALNNLGNIHAKMGHDKLAMEYYRLSIPHSLAIDDKYIFGETYLNMAKLFKKNGEQDSSFLYAKLAVAAGQSISSYKFIKGAAEYLADNYEQLQMSDSAYHYFKIAAASRDSLFSHEKVKQVQSLSFSEQLRQQELTEMKAVAATQRKNNLQMIGIAIFLVTFFTLIFLLSIKKINPRAIEIMGVVGLLLLFEFISIFIHPYLAKLSHHSPVFLLLILVCVSSVLAPLHHYLVKLLKRKLAYKMTQPVEA